MTIEQLRTLLQSYRIRPTEKLGQNFLLDDILLQDIADAAEVGPQDLVVEIGPGIGNLTRKLLAQAGHVVAIEKDQRMMPILKDLQKEYKDFEFYNEDGLRFDYSQILTKAPPALGGVPLSYKVVANIPYYITGKLIKIFLHLEPKPKSITLLVQKEVAENIVAKAGSLSILGISVQIAGVPKIVDFVPSYKFYPAPEVDSAVIHIDIPEKPPYVIPDEKDFFRVVKACFMGKRKQVHNTLSHNLGLTSEQIDSVLLAAGVESSARPQHISIPQWIKLVEAIGNNKNENKNDGKLR